MSTPSPYDVMMQRKALREEEQRLQQSHEADPPQRREEKTGARGATKTCDDPSSSGYRIVRLLPASLAMATYSDLCSCRMCELRRSEWHRRNDGDQSCDDLQRRENKCSDEGIRGREVVSHDAIHWDVSYELWDQIFTGVDGQLQPQVRHGIEATYGAALGFNTACDPLDPRGVDSFTSLAQRFINAVGKPIGQPSASAARAGDGGVSSLDGGSSKRAAGDEEDLMEEDMMDDRYAEDDCDWAFDSDKDGRTFREIAFVNARKIAMRRNALLRSQLQALHEHSFPVAYEEKFYQQLATERNAVVMIALAPTMTTGPGAVIRIDTQSNSPSSSPSPASATPPRDVAIRATVPKAQNAGEDSKEFVISTVARDVMADGNDGGFYPAAEGHAMLLREFAPTSARPPPPVATVLDGTASSIVQQQNIRSSNTPPPATASSLFSSLPAMLFGAKPPQPKPTTAPAPSEAPPQQGTAEQVPTRAKSEPFCRVSEQRLHELARTTKPRPHLTTPHFLKDAPDASSVMIGFVTVRLRANGKAFTYGGMDAYVSTFGTRRCARGHGIAGRVFEEALTLLRVWDAPVNSDEGDVRNGEPEQRGVKRYGAPAWHCRRVWLHVLSTNDAAIGFYSRRQFRQVRLFRDFYHILGGRYDALIFSRLFDARGDMNEFFDVPGETDTLALDGEYDPATHHHEEWLEQQRVPYTIDVLRERCVGNEDGYMRRTRHIAAQLAASPASLASTSSRSSDGALAALQPSPASSAPRYVPRAPPAPDASAVGSGGGITAGALPAGVGFQLPLKARPRGDRGGRDRDIDGAGDDEEEVIMDMGVQGVAVSAKPEVQGASPPTADAAFRRPTDSPVQTTPLVRPSSLQHARPPVDGEKHGERNREGRGDGGESSGDGSRAAFSQALRDAFRGGQGRPATDLRADPADLRLVTKTDAKTINANVETSDLNRRTARGDPRNTSCGGCNDQGSSAEKAYTIHDARTAELLQKERLRRHQVLSRYGADDEGARKGNDGQTSLPAELSLTAVFCSIILSVIVAGIAALYVVDV